MNPSPKRSDAFTRRSFVSRGALGLATVLFSRSLPAQEKAKTRKIETPPPTHPPLEPVDISQLPPGLERLDLFLLIGQSNMKGRGVMPDEPKHDPRLVMMHLRDDAWYLARHPLHLIGDAKTFAGADNAGVGPGLSFAENVAAHEPNARVGLIPCAKGGTQIELWRKGAHLYENAVRRAKLALQQSAAAKGRLRAALWLQGEADARDEHLPVYQEKLLALVDNLRADLAAPDLPFIACTIGEMDAAAATDDRAKINRILLALPSQRPHTACVDARDLKGNIGDHVHYDTPSQKEIGRRYAEKYFALAR